jgi:hypothetical protein
MATDVQWPRSDRGFNFVGGQKPAIKSGPIIQRPSSSPRLRAWQFETTAWFNEPPRSLSIRRPRGKGKSMTSKSALPVRRLGTTDMRITHVGFGSWAVGGDWAVGWGSQDDSASIAAIRRAGARGINWIETAAIYGLGHSEEVVAAALAPIPESERSARRGAGPSRSPSVTAAAIAAE